MSEMEQQEITIGIDAYPDPDVDIFRIGAADDILRLLADTHEAEFTIPQLVEQTGVTRSTVWRAVDLLDTIGAVQIRETPQRNYVRINTDRLQKDDPILAITQSAFQPPVRAFVERVQSVCDETEDIDELLGIIVFGSVARGDADRQSDIDLFVVVDGDRTTARRQITELVAALETERFGGDRFEFEPYVESAESAHRAAAKLREVFAEGITLYGTEPLQDIKKEVLMDE
jgi:predicted nucleotidyltransferase/biotin operon repressor